MKHTKQQIQEALDRQFDWHPTYFIWREIPPVKIWYDDTDNTFKTSVGINVCFDDYELENCYEFDGKTPDLGVDEVLEVLRNKIANAYFEKGISLHCLR